jgi:hypothetical protein
VGEYFAFALFELDVPNITVVRNPGVFLLVSIAVRLGQHIDKILHFKLPREELSRNFELEVLRSEEMVF